MGAGGGEIDTRALFREVHRGCWRADAPPLELELREVAALMPLLIRTGSVGLVWPRLRHRASEYGAVGAGLEAAYGAQVDHNARVEREIARVVGHLQGHGIDPVLIKGWAVSRLYPARIVRPAGDIDLVVRDPDYPKSQELGFGTDGMWEGIAVDLKHRATWEEDPQTDFWRHTDTVAVGGVTVRALSAEDQLRMLCFHFLKHGGIRPLWLVDVAMALETRGPHFDWGRALGDDDVERSWLSGALGVAHRLLGASIEDTPVASAAMETPAWLVRAVLRNWHPRKAIPATTTAHLVRHPRDLFTVLRSRWPDPVLATMFCHERMDERARPPIQARLYLRRIGSHVRYRLVGQVVSALRQSPEAAEPAGPENLST